MYPPPEMAKMLVAQYFNRKVEKTDNVKLDEDDVYIVWFCYILGGWKALVSTTVPDGMYYEVTHKAEHDGSDGPAETYLDAYKKFDNVVIPDGANVN